MLTIDGSYGEGGGQVVRTSLALSAITGEAIRIEKIRAGRRKPGLRPQQLACVRAAAKISGAKVEGARLNSKQVTFTPRSEPMAGTYTFDVAQVAKGGSAGSIGLLLQTVLLPLAMAEGTSQLTLGGGTHVAWSPCFDYLKRVYLPALQRMGVRAKARIQKWGWYPVGGGVVKVTVAGQGRDWAPDNLDLRSRGGMLRVRGASASSNLPKHIRVRQERAALQVLRSHSMDARLEVIDAPSKGQGTVVFLWAEFESAVAGFTSLGERGKPAEQVAEEAARDLLGYTGGVGAADRYLADQLVLPLALARGSSSVSTGQVTSHLLTNAWVVNRFLPGRIRVDGDEGGPGGFSTGTV